MLRGGKCIVRRSRGTSSRVRRRRHRRTAKLIGRHSTPSPSHIPVPLDRRLGSVTRNEDILYRDSQIAELLEITCHCCLHFLSGHMTPGRNQFSAWKPVRGGNSKIILLPRLYLSVHEFPDLHRVIVFSRIVSCN